MFKKSRRILATHKRHKFIMLVGNYEQDGTDDVRYI